MRPIPRIALLVVICAVFAAGCSTWAVQRKKYYTYLDYARPRPGHFRYVQRDVSVTVTWDSHRGPRHAGSRAHAERMSSLLTTAMRRLVCKAGLGDSQALYNVRVSAPRIDDTYLAYWVLSFFMWWRSHYAVTITADVIELFDGPRRGGDHVSG